MARKEGEGSTHIYFLRCRCGRWVERSRFVLQPACFPCKVKRMRKAARFNARYAKRKKKPETPLESWPWAHLKK